MLTGLPTVATVVPIVGPISQSLINEVAENENISLELVRVKKMISAIKVTYFERKCEHLR